MLFTLLVVLASLDNPAYAAPCAPLRAAVVEELIVEAREALFDDDLEQVHHIDAALVDRAPCLDHVVSPAVWADHLMTLAIAAYAENGDYQSPLEAALMANAAVNRRVGEVHVIARWIPPAPYTEGSVLSPEGATVHIDGRQVRYIPPLWGPHLVQVEQTERLDTFYGVDLAHEVWQSVVVLAEPEPASLAQEPDDAPLPMAEGSDDEEIQKSPGLA